MRDSQTCALWYVLIYSKYLGNLDEMLISVKPHSWSIARRLRQWKQSKPVDLTLEVLLDPLNPI